MLIILEMFFATREIVSKLGNISRIFPSFGWTSSHVTRINQSRASENNYKHPYPMYTSY